MKARAGPGLGCRRGSPLQAGVTGRRAPLLAGVAVLLVVVLVLVLVVDLRPGGGEDPSPVDRTGRAAGPTTSVPPTTTRPTTSPTPEPSSTSPPPPGVTLAFAGDVHFTGRTAALLDNPATAFGPIATTLAAADVAMVNLETAITGRGREEPNEFHFRAPPVSLDTLAAAGVDLASLANNHAVDYGPLGLRDTLEAAASGRLPVVGVGRDAAQAYAPYRTEVRGVGLAGDVVVVYLHWGVEGDPCPTTQMADLAAALAAAGADAIVGTHAHLMLGAGWLPGSAAYVAYGLGNVVWWRPQALSDDTGVLTLTVRDGAVAEATLTPALIDGAGRPQPVLGPQVAAKLTAFEDNRACTDLRQSP